MNYAEYLNSLESRRKNDQGQPLCSECESVLEGNVTRCHDSTEKARECEIATENRGRIDAMVARALTGFPGDWVDNDEAFRRATSSRPDLQTLAQRYKPQHGPVLICGTTGCGKTATANRIGRRLIREAAATSTSPHDRALYWVRGLRWIDGSVLARARRMHPLGDGEAPLVERAYEARLLIVDEVGFEQLEGTLFDVLDARDKRNLPTLVTSGLTPRQFGERYGDAALRRLIERGSMVTGGIE